MINRIVKLTFHTKHVEEFLGIFNDSKPKIEAQPGCRSVHLMQDVKNPNVMFTYSVWESEEDLDNYRKSELFGGVWPRTKALFEAKPEAWSTEAIG